MTWTDRGLPTAKCQQPWGALEYYRRALWSQTRNPKPETRNKFKCPMVQGSKPPAVEWFWSFPAWGLGFVSGFEFRISGFRALDGASSKMRPQPCCLVEKP